jgi:predicted phage-related endonuclease
MAERLAIEENEEDPMERGHRLEDEVIKKFEEETGKQVDKVGFITREDDDRIACSPDGLIKVGKKYKEAVECKCLSASRHLQAYFEKKIPSEYDFQVLQYFIVNEDLETLYFCFYDPRITVKPFFKLEVHRKDIKDDIEMYHKEQIKLLGEIDKLLAELTF